MAHMEFHITRKGAHYTADCAICCTTLHTHEWVDFDHNERRDAMQDGTLRCDLCHGRADASTFRRERNCYAARMSADGYMDCTEWAFDTNARRLERDVKAGRA